MTTIHTSINFEDFKNLSQEELSALMRKKAERELARKINAYNELLFDIATNNTDDKCIENMMKIINHDNY